MNIIYSTMIITLILFSAFLSLIHYLDMESLIVYIIGLPLYYYIGLTVFLIVLRIGLVLYRWLPVLRRTLRRTENLLNRYDNEVRKGDNPFNNPKRRFSTSSIVRSRSGKSNTIARPRKTPTMLDAFRSRFRVVSKVVPLSEKFLTSPRFKTSIRLIYYLALERTGRLAYRANCVQTFLTFVLKYQKDHGSAFTIKWLKAGYVAIQKELGQNGLTSLRELNPDLPLPALAGRLPRIIPAADRALIRSGNPSIIRFWSSLFNLYRVLKCPGEMKISTITAPYSGDTEFLDFIKFQVNYFGFFNHLKGFKAWNRKSLNPVRLEPGRSASPSSKLSMWGWLTDIYNLVTYRKDLWECLHHMAYATDPRQTQLMGFLAEGFDIISSLKEWDNKDVTGKSGKIYRQLDHLMTKSSVRRDGAPDGVGGLSQFAIKEEAAGKVRVFALIDSISQSFLRPIHDLCFEVLKQIPNDGTFDQDASVQRCMDKAVKANAAFSFDLTAATDRIPVDLSVEILNYITQNPYIGGYWKRVMVDRDFAFNSKVAIKYNVPAGPYRYAVGQPMGGLSSWAMLALTHHWIVQYAAYKSGSNSNKSWYQNYEILGDDLVIFDDSVADSYLEIMRAIGCEINLNKSIVSPNRPVFEFAKRTCWAHTIVSGISFNQLAANTSIGSRVANVLAFSKSGNIRSLSVLLSLLTRDALTRLSELNTRITQVSILALLGSLYQSGKVTLKEAMTALIHPKDGIEGKFLELPSLAALRVCYSALGLGPSGLPEKAPWSHFKDREEVFDEHENFFTVSVLNSALSSAEETHKLWKSFFIRSAHSLFNPVVPVDSSDDTPLLVDYTHDLPAPYADLVYRLEEWFGSMIGFGADLEDPAELVEEGRDLLEEFQYDEMLSLHDALTFEKKVENFVDSIRILEPKLPEFLMETSNVVPLMKSLVGLNRMRLSSAAECQAYADARYLELFKKYWHVGQR